MGEEIKNVQLSFSCSENWSNMPTAEGGRYCDKCQKTVYDFTNSKAAEFERILAENNYNLCGRFTRQQATAPIIVPFWRKWLSAAMVLIGVNVWSSKAIAQKADQHRPASVKIDEPVAPSNEIFGGVEVTPPQFPGGIDEFYKFVEQHINHQNHYPPGRVIVTFTVDPDGSLKNVKALRGPSPEHEKEAVRVVQLSPKWKPSFYGNQVVNTSYTVPIFFK